MKWVWLLLWPFVSFASPDWTKTVAQSLNESRQALVVTPASGVRAEVRLLEKANGTWKEVKQFQAVIGLAGFAAEGQKKEGDKKTPTGTYGFLTAWGSGPAPETKLSYKQVDEEDKWIDDVNSEDYNRWVHGPTQAKSFEKMKRKDGIYEYGLALDYNSNPVQKGAGSAIFLHVWRSPQKGTAGCVAVPREALLEILRWLDPAQNPKIILNPKI